MKAMSLGAVTISTVPAAKIYAVDKMGLMSYNKLRKGLAASGYSDEKVHEAILASLGFLTQSRIDAQSASLIQKEKETINIRQMNKNNKLSKSDTNKQVGVKIVGYIAMDNDIPVKFPNDNSDSPYTITPYRGTMSQLRREYAPTARIACVVEKVKDSVAHCFVNSYRINNN